MSDGTGHSPSGGTRKRTYGGVDAVQRTADRRERLMAAGLDLLGTAEEQGLTVRGVCKQSGLIARYFYESFADTDALAVAVYDQVIAELVGHALTELAAVEPTEEERLRTGLTTIIEHLAEDPRRGRVLFLAPLATPALMARRPEIVTMFTGLVRDQADEFVDLSDPERDTLARFLVGGFGEVLTAWQDGTLNLSQDQLVDLCIGMFAGIAQGAATGPPAG